MNEDANERCFSEDEQRTLACVLDQIIPPSGDGRLPGAGELGLASQIEQALRQTPELVPMISQGLSTVAELAGRRGPRDFGALPEQDKLEVMSELASADQGFLPTLTFYTYIGYYQNPRVIEGLGVEPRPPHPKGYDLEPNDLTLLEGVRRRPRMYRE